MTSVPSRQLFLAASFRRRGGRWSAPSRCCWRFNHLALHAARLAVVDELAPEGSANRRLRMVVVKRDDGIESELAVVHAPAVDDVIIPVRCRGADPARVGPRAGIYLIRGLMEDGLAVLELLRLQPRSK